jgi:uncharacterized membrane protein HdeD (DUF308 family)
MKPAAKSDCRLPFLLALAQPMEYNPDTQSLLERTHMASVTSPSELEQLRGNSGWFIMLGIVLIVAGIFMITWPFIATLAAILVYGWVLLVTSVMHLISLFYVRHWRGAMMLLLAAVLEAVLGLFMIMHVGDAALIFTLLLGIWLMVGGTFRLLAAVIQQFHNWGWVFFDGLISLVLGILVWRHWPLDWPWFIGLCLGIALLFRGWSWIALGLLVRRPMSAQTL